MKGPPCGAPPVEPAEAQAELLGDLARVGPGAILVLVVAVGLVLFLVGGRS